MKPDRKLIIAILISNSLIIIGFGHGISPLLLFEIAMPHFFDKEYLSFSLFADFEHCIYAAAIFSFLGQIIVLYSIFTTKTTSIVIGLILMILGYCYLSINIHSNDMSAAVAFVTGVPFFVLSLLALFYIWRNRKTVIVPEDE